MTTENMNKLNGTDRMTNLDSSENQISQLAHDTGKKIGTMAAEFTNSANKQFEVGKEYVEENPLKGIAIAAATGLVLGSLITLAFRRK